MAMTIEGQVLGMFLVKLFFKAGQIRPIATEGHILSCIELCSFFSSTLVSKLAIEAMTIDGQVLGIFLCICQASASPSTAKTKRIGWLCSVKFTK